MDLRTDPLKLHLPEEEEMVPKGTLTSPSFWIIGKYISFLIGGGCAIQAVRAELIIGDKVTHITTLMARLRAVSRSFARKSAGKKVKNLSKRIRGGSRARGRRLLLARGTFGQPLKFLQR